jgi:PKHD-type hydroxylase
MLTKIENFFTPSQLSSLVQDLEGLEWEDGAKTAGAAKKRKNNEQLTHASASAKPHLQSLMRHIMQHPEVNAWVQPRRIARIQFARYGAGMFYGSHNDASITHFNPLPTRADLSFTIFLNAPAEYEGGELVLESALGEAALKEAAGTIVIYDTGLRHRVEKITSGTRLVVVGWIESMIRSPEARDVLHDLTSVLRSVSQHDLEGAEAITLRRVRGNLLRMWAET